jgi:hypothetical protein
MINMFNKNPFILMAIGACIIAVTIFVLGDNSKDLKVVSGESSSIYHDKQTDYSIKPATIATQWQWTKVNQQAEQPVASETSNNLPFTAKFVYEALKAVKLDEDGNVIHDHDALLSLDEALLRIQNKLDAESLEILQGIIKDGLPGKAGEQTAKIVGDYYYFLEAKDEFSETSEALIDSSVQDTAQGIENDEMLYAELQALRDAHLGTEVSNGLFRVSDASAQYMFDSLKLDYNQDLTAEEKEQKRREIEQRHIQGSVNVANWPARYSAFQDAKQKITSALLEPEEKQRQVSELLQSHFSSEERERIQYLSLDKI